uniref:hypothetical protein n=1 Tax=Gordonia sp. B7-2 TaxID=3420932 RepID=UPI003D8A0689
MTEWTTVALRDVAQVFDGPHATPQKTIDGPWYLSISSLKQGRFDFSESAHLSDVDLPRWTKRVMPRPGDTLFSYETRLGDAAYWGHSCQAALGRRMGLLRPDPERVNPRYLSYAYLGPDFQSTIRENTLSGSTVDRIPVGAMPNWPIRLPDLVSQRVIAEVLGSIDGLIENNRRRVEVMEEMARTIYREWFVKFRYPGHADVRLVDSALGPIPSGWDIAPVSDMIAVNPRIKLDKSVEHPFIAMGDLDERTMSCRPSQVRTGGSGAKFVQGDTLFARITPCLENGKTGLVQRLAIGEVGLGSTEFIVLRGRAVGSAFTYCLARESDFRKHAIASMSGASGRQRVRNECFDTYLLPVPPRDIADAFESSMEAVFSQVAVLTDEAEQLRHLRDLLLPKLVTGQIDVSTLDLGAVVGDRVA